MKAQQAGFSFYGVTRKLIPDVLQMVQEVKVTMVRETPAQRCKLDAPELAFQFWRDTIATAPGLRRAEGTLGRFPPRHALPDYQLQSG
jgi:hypothetical protein